MKKHIATLIFGLLFSLSLVWMAYISLGIGIGLALANKGALFAYMPYTFAGLALFGIIASCLAIKHIRVARIMLLIPFLVLLASAAYIFVVESSLFNWFLIGSYGGVGLLGIITIICAFTARHE